MPKRLMGIDVGGTFTDLVLVDEDGSARVHKILNAGSGAKAAVLGAEELAAGMPPTEIVHGTTVATNAVLERAGAVTALVTTRGFRDVLELQRQDRDDVWDLYWRKPVALVPRHLRLEVDERIDANGRVLVELNAEAEADRVVRIVDECGVEAVAIMLLHSYRFPQHERAITEAIRKRRPKLHVSASHEVAAQYREYDRVSTTVLNAYLAPIVDRHFRQLDASLAAAGFESTVHVMQSNGGIVPMGAANKLAASLCMSGPAGGVLAVEDLGRRLDIADMLCLDMGGTSTDVALIRHGRAEISHDTAIDGLVTVLPTFRIETVGAGGGSIIEFDEAGMLQVGPRSAGAEPGPACYGNGGELPTVTDAWCAVGVLRPDREATSYVHPQPSLALAAGDGVARQAGTEVLVAYWQALRIATANMSRALRRVSVEQGHDPRELTLVAYGGAGGLHAAFCAEELGMKTVLIPAEPGVFSAYGMISADVKRNYVRTHIAPVSEEAMVEVGTIVAELRAAGSREFVDYQLADPTFDAQLDLRYQGQAHTVSVDVGGAGLPSAEQVAERFNALHRQRYGFAEFDSTIEVVNIRVEARVPRSAPDLRPGEVTDEATATRPLYLGTHTHGTFVQRSSMSADEPVAGPAVIEEPTSTTVVPDGWQVHRDDRGTLWLTRL